MADEAIAAAREIADMLGIAPAGHVAQTGSRRELMERARANPAAHPH